MLVATANNIETILTHYPEVLRAERFDATFMFDLPGESARGHMWKHYLQLFGGSTVTGSCHEMAVLSKDWTGAEIRACCRLAAMRGVSVKEQSALIPVISVLAKDTIEAARNAAKSKFIDASTGKIYKGPVPDVATVTKSVAKRQIKRNDN